MNVTVQNKNGEHAGGEVWLCPLERAVAVDIDRGENHGRTITYHNVVRRWVKLGDWGGTDATWTVPLSEINADGIDAAAVMVQEGTHDKPGIILGAAMTALQATRPRAYGRKQIVPAGRETAANLPSSSAAGLAAQTSLAPPKKNLSQKKEKGRRLTAGPNATRD